MKNSSGNQLARRLPPQIRPWGRSLRFTLILVTIVGLVWLAAHISGVAQPVLAQQPGESPATSGLNRRIREGNAWKQVYAQHPDLPLENTYVNLATGDVDSDNTLVGRLIRYHLYVKGRPAGFRLDWKLTLADYLGANDLIQMATYPGYDTLKVNPMTGDRAAIGRLTLDQRNALVESLVEIFNPSYTQLVREQAAAPVRSSASQPERPTTPTLAPLPSPGAAQLLMP